MEAIAISLLAKFWPVLVGLGAVALAYLRGRSTGKQTERNARARAKVKSLEDQLEMDREATEAERKAAGMTDEEARAEAMKWAKH